MSIVVIKAKKVITMNPSMPEAKYIAVKDKRILSVGGDEVFTNLNDYTLNEEFSDSIIMPGFVEGHSHALEGVIWDYLYTGYFDRKDPEGKIWKGLKSLEAVQDRLKKHANTLKEGEPLVAWGFDPIYFEGERLNRQVIDQVVNDRPVAIVHANLHVMTVNTAMIQFAEIDPKAKVEGVLLEDNGFPNGELQEMAAMHAVMSKIDLSILKVIGSEAIMRYGRACKNVGITTATDLYNPLSGEAVLEMKNASAQQDFAIRVVPAMGALNYSPQEGVNRLLAAKENSDEKLHIGLVKLMTDGSIQGFTARMKWPHYHNGEKNGIWNAPPETLKEIVTTYHQAGIQLHIHTNGDEAVELMLDAIEEAQTLWPRFDHRHTLQHCQVITHSQLKRAKSLGVCLSMFSNHLFYWGDVHYEKTLGHERCQRLEPIASSKRLGIVTTVHCDAPVTPLGPLFTAWCAIARLTSTGRQLGSYESVGIQSALEMITIDAAYTLNLDDKIGSVEIGKYADFTILEKDPLECPVDEIPNITVLATILGGKVQYAE